MRTRSDVIATGIPVVASGDDVTANKWRYRDFPVLGGLFWTVNDGDVSLAEQANELREGLRRRMVLAGTATTNLPDEVEVGERVDYHWITAMRQAIEDLLDDAVYRTWGGATNPGPSIAWTKATLLAQAHTHLDGGDCALAPDDNDWTLIAPDEPNFVYGDKTGDTYEQIDDLWRVKIRQGQVDSNGKVYMSLASRPASKFRVEIYSDAARTSLELYTGDFAAGESGVKNLLGAFSPGDIRVVEPAIGWQEDTDIEAQIPDKRVIWSEHINEIYYALEYLVLLRMDDSPAFSPGTPGGEDSSGGDSDADIGQAYVDGWAAFVAAGYSNVAGQQRVYSRSRMRLDSGTYFYDVIDERVKDNYYDFDGWAYEPERLLLPFYAESNAFAIDDYDPLFRVDKTFGSYGWDWIYGAATKSSPQGFFDGWLGIRDDSAAIIDRKAHVSWQNEEIDEDLFGRNDELHEYEVQSYLDTEGDVFAFFDFGGYRSGPGSLRVWKPADADDVYYPP